MGVPLYYSCSYIDHTEDADGVEVVAQAQSHIARWRTKYLVGCDGGASQVRKHLGIALEGEGNLLTMRQALIHCPALFDLLPLGDGPGKGRHYHIADQSSTMLIMQDSTEHWTLHTADTNVDLSELFCRVVGLDLPHTVLFYECVAAEHVAGRHIPKRSRLFSR
jgi:2-polyprenyl-6-methoxyphenol hydroxylase-like FAD-dependent oxidoreductase